MSMLRVAAVVAGVLIVGSLLVYLVLAPLSQISAAASDEAAKRGDLAKGWVRYSECGMVLTLSLTAVAVLFGTLSIPGAQDGDGNFREQRVRLSIALTVLTVYILFFSMSVFWSPGGANEQMVQSLTNLLMVVIPFYFGSSAFAQVAEKRLKKAQPGATDNPDDAQRLREDH